MPPRLYDIARAPRVALLAALLPLLAECGPTRNQFPPVCPGAAILGDAANLDAYRPGRTGAGGADLVDLVLHARIIGIQGSCKEGDQKNQLAVAVQVGVELTRGPAMPGRETDVPIFVAVTQGETILDKHVYLMHATFPSNVDRVTLSPSGVNLVLPVTAQKTGAAYSIIAGFQLTPDQLAPRGSGS